MAGLGPGIKAKLLPGAIVDDQGRQCAQFELHIAWWAWPILFWRGIREEYEIPWYRFPFALWVILRCWVETLTEPHQ